MGNDDERQLYMENKMVIRQQEGWQINSIREDMDHPTQNKKKCAKRVKKSAEIDHCLPLRHG